MASLLLICRQAPYANAYAREALDIALASAAFDIEVTLLFRDDGVLQLLKSQNTSVGGQKNMESLLSSLPLYDISSIWVDTDSLKKRGISVSDLSLQTQGCNGTTIAEMYGDFDRVICI